jgi:hypothetical protein
VNGAALFGILDLVPTQVGLLVPQEARILSLGFRNATDQSLAIQGVAGAHVMVCDNLTLSGETFAFKRKNTTGLDLGDAIATGFDRFLQHARILERRWRLSGTTLDGRATKQIIFDAVQRAHRPDPSGPTTGAVLFRRTASPIASRRAPSGPVARL